MVRVLGSMMRRGTGVFVGDTRVILLSVFISEDAASLH